MLLTFDLPMLSSDTRSTSKEMTEVKNYLYRLTEQLRYVLANLDGDNFSGELTEEIRSQINNSIASLKAALSRLNGEMTAVKNASQNLPVIKSGSAEIGDDGTVQISYEGFFGAPVVTACCASKHSGSLSVYSVTDKSAVISLPGAEAGTKILWTAIYTNDNNQKGEFT